MVELVRPQPGAVPTFRTESIDDATRRQRQMGDLAGAAANFALNYRNYASRRQVDRADTETALQYQADTESIFSKPYASAKELRDLGIDEDFMYEMAPGTEGPEKVDREEIALDEFQPLVTEKVLGRIIDANAQNITMGSERERWLNEKRRSMASVIMKQQGAAMEARFERAKEEEKRAINALLAAGMDDMAREQAKNFVDPAQRDALVLAVDKTSAVNYYNNTLQSMDPAAMMRAAGEVVEDSRLSEPEQTALQRQLMNAASEITGTRAKERVARWDWELATINQHLESGDPAALAMAVQFYNMLETQDRLDYVPKTWLSDVTEKYNEKWVEMEEQRQVDMVTISGLSQAALGPIDADRKQSIDRVTTDMLRQGIESGNPVAYSQALNQAAQLSINWGYLAEPLEGFINGVNNPNTTWQQAAQVLTIYDKLMTENHHLLKDVSDTTKHTMAFMREAVAIGETPQDAFQQYRDTIFTNDQNVLDRRQSMYQELTRGSNKKNILNKLDKQLEAHPQFGGGFVSKMTPFVDFSQDPTDPVRVAYMTAFRNNFLMTGDKDQAFNYAFDKVVSGFGMTNVNGREQIFRRPPETAYNVSTQDVRRDLKRFLKSVGINDQFDQYQLVENVGTSFGDQPYYSVAKIDEMGFPDFLTNKGVHVKWKPDVTHIAQSKLEETINKAKYEHDWETKPEEMRAEMRRRDAERLGLPAIKERYEERKGARSEKRQSQREEDRRANLEFVERRSQEKASDAEIIEGLVGGN